MPELNGIEATRIIRDDMPEIKVLISSREDGHEHVQRFLEAGASGYLLKESAGKNLLGAVRRIKRGKQHLGSKVVKTVIDEFIHHPGADSAYDPFCTPNSRERQVLQMLAKGNLSAATTEAFFLLPKAIETHRSRLMQKLRFHDSPNLVKLSI